MTLKAEYRYTTFRSPVGTIYLLTGNTGNRGLLAVGLGEKLEKFKARHQRRAPAPWKKVSFNQDKLLGSAVRSLKAYFENGSPLSFDISPDFEGTRFQRKVWDEIHKIPYGEIRSYSQIARKIGSPSAVRAVGTACGANPLPLFIPCHRVVGSGGSLGGFGGGLNLKIQLLELEGVGPIFNFK